MAWAAVRCSAAAAAVLALAMLIAAPAIHGEGRTAAAGGGHGLEMPAGLQPFAPEGAGETLLRPIFEARRLAMERSLALPSPGHGATAQSVFPPDDRTYVTDTSAIPYRWVVQLVLDFPDGAQFDGYCTGFLLAPDVVLTAAHCVYDRDTQQMVMVVLAIPGTTNTPYLVDPYGIGSAIRFDIAFPQGYTTVPAPDYVRYDFAIIRLSNAPWGAAIGPFPDASAPWVAALSPQELGTAMGLWTAGYPGDWCTPYGETLFCTMVEETLPIAGSWVGPDDWELDHLLDTAGGQSGSALFAIWSPDGERPRASPVILAGVHSTGGLPNVARRANAEFVAAIVQYCDLLGCAFAYDLGEPQPPPAPTPTPPAPPSPAATATATPTPQPTQAPSPPPSPTATQTPLPTQVPPSPPSPTTTPSQAPTPSPVPTATPEPPAASSGSVRLVIPGLARSTE